MRIILASASPRRKEILKKLFREFEAVPAQIDENSTTGQPEELVTELSCQKASEAEKALFGGEQKPGGHRGEYLIIGADTVVAAKDGSILGKPQDETQAGEMLRMLSGNMHRVYTGITVILNKDGVRRCMKSAECTKVFFYPMSEAEIEAYIRTGEPMDKAGAYGIQGIGGRFVERIEGSYDNVVGLPAAKLFQILKECCSFDL